MAKTPVLDFHLSILVNQLTASGKRSHLVSIVSSFRASAERADGVIHIVPVERAAELPLAELQRSWLLVGFGRKSHFNACDYPWPTDFRSWVAGPHYLTDCPMLLVFENSPVELAPTGNGLRARFNGVAGHFALLPLYGQLHPHVADTEQWAHGLPEKIAQTCDWWAGSGGAPDANHFFAAAVGAIRLARMGGDKEAETLGWGLLARAAMLRFGMAKYAHYLLDNRLYVLPEQPDWMIRFSSD